ncbi:hypothetical protein ACTXT7_007015 [Hymenolepis weldensis]
MQSFEWKDEQDTVFQADKVESSLRKHLLCLSADEIRSMMKASIFNTSLEYYLCLRQSYLGVMVDICLGIYVQTRKHTAGPPVDTIVEILASLVY